VFDGVWLWSATPSQDADDGEDLVVARHGRFPTDGLGDDPEMVVEIRLEIRLELLNDEGTVVVATCNVHETRISEREEN
jgi:hypothetical protein